MQTMAVNNFNQSNLKIVAWNCQSILNKIPETHSFLTDHRIDIAFFTETWLTPSKNIVIPNYTIHRHDRSDGQHGGVLICVKDNIHHSVNAYNTKIIETIGISISVRNDIIKFVCCYFPGTSTNAQNISDFKQDIRTLTNCNSSYFLIGDFNSKHTLWNNVKSNQGGKALYDEMSIRNFVVHHSQTPTYFPPQSRALHPSTIDLVLTNNLHSISTITTSNELTSDHLPILFTIDCFEIPKCATKLNYRYDLANWQQFQRILNETVRNIFGSINM